MSDKGPIQALERDGLKLPQRLITRSKARQMRMKLNGTIQDFISKTLDAYKKEKKIKIPFLVFKKIKKLNLGPILLF
ncbi:hypothetical protein Gotur_024968 [Gossypium turneri]